MNPFVLEFTYVEVTGSSWSLLFLFNYLSKVHMLMEQYSVSVKLFPLSGTAPFGTVQYVIFRISTV